jgi:hypothetical protein
MDKIKVLRDVIRVVYPDLNFVARKKRNGNFQIIIKGVKDIFYDVNTFERKIKLKNDNNIVIDNLRNNLEGFYPFLVNEDCEIKFIMWNGKTHNL